MDPLNDKFLCKAVMTVEPKWRQWRRTVAVGHEKLVGRGRTQGRGFRVSLPGLGQQRETNPPVA